MAVIAAFQGHFVPVPSHPSDAAFPKQWGHAECTKVLNKMSRSTQKRESIFRKKRGFLGCTVPQHNKHYRASNATRDTKPGQKCPEKIARKGDAGKIVGKVDSKWTPARIPRMTPGGERETGINAQRGRRIPGAANIHGTLLGRHTCRALEAPGWKYRTHHACSDNVLEQSGTVEHIGP